MSLRLQRWLYGIALILILGSLRFPWRECDAGNWGIWSYGSFNTDEGEYTGGGRLMFLTGEWLDPEMGYPSTLRYAPAMHLLSAISYEICGLSIAAARWPTMLAAVVAWLMVYHIASRATVPWLAGVMTLVASCNPVSLTYERWGSSDVVFTAGVVAAWWLQRKPSPWRATATGAMLGFAILTKMTAIVFVPFLFAAIAARHRQRTRRVWCFNAALIAVFVAGQLWVTWCVNSAAAEGLNLADFPSGESMLTFDLPTMLKALSLFPRPYTAMHLVPFILWLMLLPLWYLVIIWQRTGRLLTPRMMMCAALFVYVATLAVQARNPIRYFVPLLYFAPLMLAYGHRMLPRTNARPVGFVAVLLVSIAAMFWVYWKPVNLPSDAPNYFFANEYILPEKSGWNFSWPVRVGSAVLLAAVALVRLGSRQWFVAGTLSASAAWIFTAGYGYANTMGTWCIPQRLQIQCGVIAVFVVLLAGRQWRRSVYWYLCAALSFYVAVLFTPSWQRAFFDLASRQYTVRCAGERIASLLPADSVVIGRRATTLLEPSLLRVGHFTLCGYGKGDASAFAQRLSELLKTAPRGTVYWLLASDSVRTCVSPDQQEIFSQFQVELVDTIPVLHDSAPALVPMYMLKVRRIYSLSNPVSGGGTIYYPLRR
jgi:4-amino-4-deoxy-L-arabinose transferase-like glycosyltransferase